jgi:hypothetical protein
MIRRRPILNALAAHLGEALREIAVLVAVFAPLDMIVQDRSLTFQFVAGMILVVALVFGLGFYLEVKSWKR